MSDTLCVTHKAMTALFFFGVCVGVVGTDIMVAFNCFCVLFV
jgi:hypothetical protein